MQRRELPPRGTQCLQTWERVQRSNWIQSHWHRLESLPTRAPVGLLRHGGPFACESLDQRTYLKVECFVLGVDSDGAVANVPEIFSTTVVMRRMLLIGINPF
jgi:hypothetical protein